MLVFPIGELMDEAACLRWLEQHLHPEGLRCPRCGSTNRRDFRPYQAFPSYRCRDCQRPYTVVTGSAFEKTRQQPSTIVLLLRGVGQGVSTTQLSEELDLSYKQAHTLRKRLHDNANETAPQSQMEGTHFESDEVYQNAEKKATSIPTPTTRRAGVAITDQAEERMRTTGRRCARSSVGRPVRYGSGCSTRRTRRVARGYCKRCCRPVQRSSATSWRATKDGQATSRSAIRRTSGREMTMATACERYTATRVRVLALAFAPFLQVFRGVHKGYLACYLAVYEAVRNAKRISPEIVQRLCFGNRLHTSYR